MTKETKEKDKKKDNECVIRALASAVGRPSRGKDHRIRKEQIESHQQSDKSPSSISMYAIDNDLINIKQELVPKLQQSGTCLGKELTNYNIELIIMSSNEILQAVKAQKAVLVAGVNEDGSLHLTHLGLNGNNFISLSDGNLVFNLMNPTYKCMILSRKNS